MGSFKVHFLAYDQSLRSYGFMDIFIFQICPKISTFYFSSNHLFYDWNQSSTPKNGGLGNCFFKIEQRELFLEHFSFWGWKRNNMKNALNMVTVAQFFFKKIPNLPFLVGNLKNGGLGNFVLKIELWELYL